MLGKEKEYEEILNTIKDSRFYFLSVPLMSMILTSLS